MPELKNLMKSLSDRYWELKARRIYYSMLRKWDGPFSNDNKWAKERVDYIKNKTSRKVKFLWRRMQKKLARK